MARIRRSITLTLSASSPWCRMVNRRSQSSSSSDPLIWKLEEAIQCIMVRRSAPDWLPFVPGSSYWVPPPPPQPSNALAQLLHDLANPTPTPPRPHHHQPMPPAWPSSSYFIQGVAPQPLDSQNEHDDEEELE